MMIIISWLTIVLWSAVADVVALRCQCVVVGLFAEEGVAHV